MSSHLLRKLRANEDQELEPAKYYSRIRKENERRRRRRHVTVAGYDEYVAQQQRQLISAIESNSSVTDMVIYMEDVPPLSVNLNAFDLFLQPLTRLRNLRSLDITFHYLHFSTFRMFMEERWDLQELSVRWWDQVKLFSETDKIYLSSLQPNTAFSSLRTASFCNTGNYFDLTNDRKRDVGFLLKVLPRMTLLQSLELTNWQITSLGILASLLANSHTLESLSLTRIHLVEEYDNYGGPLCGLPDKWDALLIHALKSNSSLIQIHLEDINVSETVFCSMASEAMTRHPSIQNVTLIHILNNFSQRIKVSLVQLLQQNRGITYLKLDVGQKDDSTMDLIQCYVRINQIHKNTEELVSDHTLDHNQDVRVEVLIQAYDDLGCLHL